MQALEVPLFLESTFLWTQDGYTFSASPPDLRDPSLISGNDPWLALAACLVQAKQGQLRYVGELQSWLGRTRDRPFLEALLTLVGDAGTAGDMSILLTAMAADDHYVRARACEAASHAGYLWLASEMLATWQTITPRERSAVSLYLSHMLDAPGSTGVFDFEAFDSDEEYADFVAARIRSLERELGGTDAIVYLGGRFDVDLLVVHMLSELRTTPSGRDPPSLGHLRHRFEAATGIDCRSFYRNDEIRPLSAVAVLESYQARAPRASMPEGIRFFFGHPIP